MPQVHLGTYPHPSIELACDRALARLVGVSYLPAGVPNLPLLFWRQQPSGGRERRGAAGHRREKGQHDERAHPVSEPRLPTTRCCPESKPHRPNLLFPVSQSSGVATAAS